MFSKEQATCIYLFTVILDQSNQLSAAARHDQNFIHYVSQVSQVLVVIVVQACSSIGSMFLPHSMVLLPCAEESFPGCRSAFTQCGCERNARRAGCVLDWTTNISHVILHNHITLINLLQFAVFLMSLTHRAGKHGVTRASPRCWQSCGHQ